MGIARDFCPDWTSPPGDSIIDLCKELNINENQLCLRLGLSALEVEGLLRGALPIDERIALALSHLGGSVRFWIRREKLYLASLRRLGLKRPD